MAELGGMLAAAILKVVGDQIGSAIGGQITLQKNFDADLKKMNMALESVEAVLKAAERRSITDEPTRLWLKRLTDAMYDISSMIDAFEADTHPSGRKLSLKKHLLRWVCCLPVGPKITMANQMQMMRDELKEITDNHHNFTLGDTSTGTIQLNVTHIRETSAIMGDTEHVIGRKYEKEKILSCLSESVAKEFIVLPIYGIGGLGKTTLAKIVFSNSQFRGYSQVWIYVSEIFDLKKIGNAIITQLSKEKSQHTEMQMIYNSLRELLANNKILIVLADLWEEKKSHLDELMNMLKVGESGNVVVIVTTRSENIAKKLCTIQPHKLASLTDEMCWTIIKKKSDFELRDDQEELGQIGETIASKCGGVALAAQTLGHMLHSLSFGEWESVGNSDIWNLSDSEDTSLTHVLASLSISYSVLPSNLKLCFAYCAIFPKGYKIVKDDLIRQWISLGFIKATNMLSTWQLGEKYIRQLVGLSFLEHSKSELVTGVDFENDTLFTMHDLVHDLARSVMIGELLVPSKNGSGRGSCCHFALLDNCSKPLESSKIRALRFMECGEVELNGSAFSSSKSIRVLDLSECCIHNLPDSIGVLRQLRYLSAPRVQDAIIPNSMTRLSKLIYLNLHGSSRIKALPKAIGEMEGLAYLDLSGCSGIENLPESFSSLKELVHLNFSNCSCIGGISEFLGSLTQLQYLNLSHCPKIGEMPEALGGLSQLQSLNLSFSSYLECCQEAEVLGTLTKLEYLNLSSECCDLRKLPEGLGRFIHLKYLNLSGCSSLREFPRLFGSQNKLVQLDLSYCCSVHGLEEALVGLTNLQYLNLKSTCLSSLPGDLTKLRYLNISDPAGSRKHPSDSLINHISSNLSDLEHLDSSRDISVESIPESVCSLRKLHTLDLSGCKNLWEIPKAVGTMDSLKFLNLTGCIFIGELPFLTSGSVSLPHFVVHAGDGDSSSNLVLLEHTDPIELQISKLENVKSAAEAHRIKLMGKGKLNSLKLEWTGDVKRFVDDKMLLEKLVPPNTLKRLEICGYNGVSFPAWLVGQLPNIKELFLKDMANLVEWNTSYSSGEEHVIEILEIHDCPLLRMKPLPPKAKAWVISNSDNVLSSWEECTGSPEVIRHLSSLEKLVPPNTLKRLEICGYNGVSFPAWLVGQLPNLERLVLRDMASQVEWNTSYASGEEHVIEELVIRDCPLLRMKPLPPKAKKWRISNCDNVLSSWEECTGSHTNATSSFSPVTTDLSVENCKVPLHQWSLLQHFPGLTSLSIEGSVDPLTVSPEVIRHLSSLETLRLEDADFEELPKWLNENKRQLTKLQSLHLCRCYSMASLPHWLGELTSLKELTLRGCDVLSCLPESIQQLAGLQTLSIFGCPELKCLVERACLLPSSLENLEIGYCNGIKSLPEGMERLTNLKKLDIYSGPELMQW